MTATNPDGEFDTTKSAEPQTNTPAVSAVMPKSPPQVAVTSAPPSALEQPPPVPGKPDLTDDVDLAKPKATAKEVLTDAGRRHVFGWASAILGSAVIVAVLWWAAAHVSDAIELIKEKPDQSALERVVMISLGARAVIALAAIFFGYSMLRIAERMFLPRHLLHDERTAGVVRALLGVSTPTKAVVDGVKQAAEDIATIAKPFAELAKPIVEAVKGASGGDKDKK